MTFDGHKNGVICKSNVYAPILPHSYTPFNLRMLS